MWSYYGSKSKVVDFYPPPKYGKIIEPFAGSARYSLKFFDRDITLVDKYEVIVRIWKWLQQASEKDIMSLPVLPLGTKINRNDFDCIEQAWLMGFIVQQGVNAPRLTVSKFADEANMRSQKKNIASYSRLGIGKSSWVVMKTYQTQKQHGLLIHPINSAVSITSKVIKV